MKKQGEVRVVLLLFGVLVVIVLGIIFMITSTSSATEYPLPAPNGACNTLYYNGENAIDLVFFADEANTKKYMDHLLSTPPYNQFQKSFNAYYIDETVDCKTYKDIAILCHSRDLILQAGRCPNDFTFVLKEAGNLRSSAYQGVGSINTNHPLSVLTHEGAHMFTSHDEEYLPASAHTNSVNCKQSCDEFTNPDGCYAGCSESDLYRSIDNGVMRTLNTNDLGTHNKNAIAEWIVENTGDTPSTITGNQIAGTIPACLHKTYYYIETDPLTNMVIDKRLHIGCYPEINAYAPNAAILTQNGAFAYERTYDPFLYTEAPGTETGLINEGVDGVFTNEPVALTLPELSADTLELFDEQGNLQQSISLLDVGRSPCIIE